MYFQNVPYNGTIPTIGGGYNYYNPFYIQQQMRLQQQQQMQLFNQQVDLWRRMSTSYFNYLGKEVPEEYQKCLDRRFDIERYREQKKEDDFFNELANISYQIKQEELLQQQRLQQREEMIKKASEEKSEYDGMTAYEWLAGPMTERHVWALEQKALQNQRKNVANLYDPNSYNRLLGIHNSSFNSLNTNVNIDDMEIGLPPGLRNVDRMQRRQAFLDSIMKTEKAW